MFLPGDMLPTTGFSALRGSFLAVTLADLDARRCHGRARLQKPPFYLLSAAFASLALAARLAAAVIPGPPATGFQV